MSDIRGSVVSGSGGRRLGTVRELLLAPDAPAVIGLVVRRPRIFGMLERSDRYIALASTDIVDVGSVVLRAKGLPKGRVGQRAAGIRWEATVIWRGMVVATPDGTSLGAVRDFRFDTKTGTVTGLTMSGGVVADAALGSIEVAGDEIIGYEDGAVRVSREVAGRRGSGGAASTAGRAAARAVVVGEKAAKVAGKHAETAARGAGRAYGKLRDFVKDGWQDEER